MPTDIVKLLSDYHVAYDSTVNPGWINVPCPFCGDRSAHLGFRIGEDYANCWRCGGHSLFSALAGILRLAPEELKGVLSTYRTEDIIRARLNKKVPKAVEVELPGGEFTKGERRYLAGRGFDPDFLRRKYRLTGGGIAGDWKYRIIIPLIIGGRVVSFTARDITGEAKLRYRTLPIEDSVVDPKTALYNEDNVRGKWVVVVEGPFDVLRMGDGFVCSFGTSMTQAQIKRLSRYARVTFMFDPEAEAQARALKYARELSAIGGVEVDVVDTELGTDPGDLTAAERDELRGVLGL